MSPRAQGADEGSALSNLATTYVARTINTLIPAAAISALFGGSPPPLVALVFAQVLLAIELYQPIRRLVAQDRQSVVLALQALYLAVSLRQFHGRHIAESILSATWIQRSRLARILEFILVDRMVTTMAVAGLLCISAFEAIARKQRDMMAVIAVSAGMTWLVSAPSAVLVRAMRSSPAWMMLVCWVAVLREVSGFAHGQSSEHADYSVELIRRRADAVDNRAERWLQERAELYARAVRSDQAHAELNQTVADQDQRLACLQGDADALASCSAEEIERCLQGMERALPAVRESLMTARVQQAQALARREVEEERTTCAICMQRPRDCLLSCGHILCTACGQRADCPFCRKRVRTRSRAFL